MLHPKTHGYVLHEVDVLGFVLSARLMFWHLSHFSSIVDFVLLAHTRTDVMPDKIPRDACRRIVELTLPQPHVSDLQRDFRNALGAFPQDDIARICRALVRRHSMHERDLIRLVVGTSSASSSSDQVQFRKNVFLPLKNTGLLRREWGSFYVLDPKIRALLL